MGTNISLDVKTSYKIYSVFGERFTEPKNPQAISENEMPAPMGIPFSEVPHIVFNFFSM
jgi:hypothetical protein